MNSLPRTTKALRRTAFLLRQALCEELIWIAYRVAPNGYTPSASEVAADLYELGLSGRPATDYRSRHATPEPGNG